MRVLHCCYRYFPDRGGSETYVSSLVHALKTQNVQSIIASAGEPCETYAHDGITVHRLGHVKEAQGVTQSTISTPSDGYVKRLHDLINEARPDVIHFHWHPGGIADLMTGLSKPNIPLVFTFHHPSITCYRGDLLRFGSSPCSGVFSRDLCLSCAVHCLGVTPVLASILSLLPDDLCGALGRQLPKGRLRTAAGFGQNLSFRLSKTHRFLDSFQRVIVLSEWSRLLLIANGVKRDRLELSRLGTHHPVPPKAVVRANKVRGSTIRGVFVGRLDSVKGVHILAEAMKAIAESPVAVDVYGPLDGADVRLAPFIAAGTKPGAKLRFLGNLRDSEVVNTMQKYDFAIVCSQFFETGPYTVIEAFQAELPVLGTDIGGINEMVSHNCNGWLIPLHSIQGWASALRMLGDNPSILEGWRRNVLWNRSMGDVAREIANTYRAVLGEFIEARSTDA